MIMYGSNLCPDTIYAINKCMDAQVDFKYKDITGCLAYMKEFLILRDKEKSDLFTAVRENGNIGIHFFVFDDGFATFDYQEAINYGLEHAK